MNANRNILVTLLPLFLMIVSLACNLSFQSTTEVPFQTEAPTETRPAEETAPANPTNTAPSIETPTATEAPPEPTSTQAPTATPSAFPTVAAGILKEQLFYGGMGGGGGDETLCEEYIPEPGSELPLIVPEGRSDNFGMLDTLTFCIFGFPFYEDVRMTVTAPDGALMSEAVLRARSDETESSVRRFDENGEEAGWIGEAQEVEGMQTVRVFLWIPLGLPYGMWNLAFESQSASFESGFENTPPEGMAISVLPQDNFDLFPGSGCETFGPGETAYIFGHGFEPRAALPLGIYVATDWGDAVLVDSLLVSTGEQGEFSAWVNVKETYPEGIYHIIPNEAIIDDYVQYIDATGCLVIEGTSGVLEPIVPLYGPWEACPGTYWSNLRVGDTAMVSQDPPLPNRVRQTPNKQGEVLGQIPPGENLLILDGPECANGWVWWYISAENQNLSGWTAEGDETSYWLILVE